MYFYRCYNQNNRYSKSRPYACQPEKPHVPWEPHIPREPDALQGPHAPQEPKVLFRTASAGGLHLSGFTGAEKEYDLIALKLDFCSKESRTTIINFACGITFLDAAADIRVQLVKAGGELTIPVSSPAVYRRIQKFSGADALCFTVQDTFSAKDTSCCYLVKLTVTGSPSENGAILLTAPVLSAIII